jgi:AcrR family transcriptional regulator
MRHDDTRQKILEVASRLFSKYGFKKTSVDEIARAAHKAKGSVYYHFPSKEDLFREVVENELSHVKSELARIAGEHVEPATKLKQYLTMRMLLMGHAVNYHETLKADLLEQLDFVEEIKSGFYRFETELVKDMLKEGIQNGTFVELDYTMVAELYVLVCKGLEMPFYLQKKYLEYASKLEQLNAILLNGLLK